MGKAQRYLELSLVLALGTANVLSELAGKGKLAVVVGGLVAWSLVLVRRQKRAPGFLARALALPQRWDGNLALLAGGTVAGVGACAAIGALNGKLSWDVSHWLMLGLYPLWGLAQQFLLQEVLACHLRALLPRTALPLAAGLFALAHAPAWGVAAAVLPAALFWVWLYPRVGSLPPFAVAHGFVGTAFFAWVEGRSFAQALALTLS